MNAGLADSEATWPGVLFLEVPEQGLVVAEMRSLAGLSEFDKRDLAARLLPVRIRASKADRFAWVMPAWRHDVEPQVECLIIVLGEPGHTEALVADVVRGDGPPRLGEWSGPTKKVTGLFADPLARALLAKPRSGRGRTLKSRQRADRRPTQPTRRRKQEREQPARSPTGRPLRPTCPDCVAAIGEPHRPGCDVEPCSICLGQRLICDCPGHDPLAVIWEGEWPGASACRTLGWWAIRTDQGWRPCPPGTPGAIEDINRLTFFRETGMDCLYDELE
jgi:hypothetical protein